MTNKEREFLGYLMGEGCFRISTNRKPGYQRIIYRPQISVAQRADDMGALIWAKERFGGTLIRSDGRRDIPKQNPSFVWMLTSANLCKDVLSLFLQLELPSAKTQQAQVLWDFCKLKEAPKKKHPDPQNPGRFFWRSEEDYRKEQEMFEHISQLKRYKV